jgi:iron(III) transport system substrate-binding protein
MAIRRTLRRIILTFISVIALSGSLVGCSSPSSEGEILTVYSGRSEEFISPFIDKFTKETGISLDIRFGDSAALAAQLLEEGTNSPADLFLSQDAGSLGAASSAGLFAQLPTEILSRVDEKYRSPSSDWVGVTGRVRVFAYAPDRVTLLPKTIDDLADPQWKGRLGIAPTNGSFQSFVTALIQSRGEAAAEKWLTTIKNNNPVLYEKNSQIMEAIDNGQIDIGLVNHYYLWEVAEELGRDINVKIDFFQAGDIGNLTNVSGAAILATSDKQSVARKFVEFLLRDDVQKSFVADTHEYSLVIPTLWPEGLPALKDVKSPAVDLASLADLRRTQALLVKVGLI